MVKSISPGFKSGMKFEINTVTKPSTPTPSTANKPPRAVNQHKEMMSRTAPKKRSQYNVPGAFTAKPDSDKKFMGSDLTRRVNAVKNFETAYKHKKRKGKK